MAWIAALISGLAGGGMAAAGNQAAGKANKKGGALTLRGYQTASNAIAPYESIGGSAANSLATLMGLEGYRTPEEIAYTEYLRTKPKAPAASNPSYTTSSDWTTGGPQREVLGDTFANALSPTTVLGGPLAFSLTDSVFGGSDNKEKNAMLMAKYKNMQAQKKYEKDLAEWETKRAELEGLSTSSLSDYDPMAALRNTPGYQTRYQEGLNTAQNSMAGSLLSGNALRGLTEYGQTFASNERGNEIGRLAGIAGMGQNAATTRGNWATGASGIGTNLALQQGQNAMNYYGNLNNVMQGTLGNYLEYQNRSNAPTSNNLYGYSSPGVYGSYSPVFSGGGFYPGEIYGTSEGE